MDPRRAFLRVEEHVGDRLSREEKREGFRFRLDSGLIEYCYLEILQVDRS